MQDLHSDTNSLGTDRSHSRRLDPPSPCAARESMDDTQVKAPEEDSSRLAGHLDPPLFPY
jgi:hypothetical protein